jgi:hypothetical protein
MGQGYLFARPMRIDEAEIVATLSVVHKDVALARGLTGCGEGT